MKFNLDRTIPQPIYYLCSFRCCSYSSPWPCHLNNCFCLVTKVITSGCDNGLEYRVFIFDVTLGLFHLNPVWLDVFYATFHLHEWCILCEMYSELARNQFCVVRNISSLLFIFTAVLSAFVLGTIFPWLLCNIFILKPEANISKI